MLEYICLIKIGMIICLNSVQNTAGQQDGYIYVAGSFDVYMINETTGSRVGLLSTYFPTVVFTNIVALVYSEISNSLFFSDNTAHQIMMMTLQGLYPTYLTYFYSEVAGVNIYDGLAVDADYIYVTDANEVTGGEVFRVALVGRNKQTIFSAYSTKPRAIIIDRRTKNLYWTDWGNYSRGIYTANMNNGLPVTAPTKLVSLEFGSWPNAFAIDFDANSMYWGDAFYHKIESSGLDGSNRRVLYTDLNTRFYAFALVTRKIYFTDWNTAYYLWEFNLTTLAIKVNSVQNFVRPCGIAHRSSPTPLNTITTGSTGSTAAASTTKLPITLPERQPCLSYPCGNGGDCLELVDDYRCECKPGFLQIDYKRCDDIDECITGHCYNGGICINGYNRFSCICPSNYIGLQCEILKTLIEVNKIERIQVINIPRRKFSISGGSVCQIEGSNFENFIFLGAYLNPKNINLKPLYAYAKELCTTGAVCIYIPRADSDYSGAELKLVLHFAGFNISLEQNFAIFYIDNPKIEDIQPRRPFIHGGIFIFALGENLEGVSPINMTYEVSATDGSSHQNGKINSVCSLYNSTAIQCPFVGFDYFDEKYKDINNSNIKFKISMGFIMGNYLEYRNLAKAKPNIASSFDLTLKKPSINPFDHNVVYFVPEETIKIKGSDIDTGATKESYEVLVGASECPIHKISSNLIECLPPQTKPPSSLQSELCSNREALMIQVRYKLRPNHEGSAYCLLYRTAISTIEIVGIASGCGAFLMIAIAAIFCLYHRCCRNKSSSRTAKNSDKNSEETPRGQAPTQLAGSQRGDVSERMKVEHSNRGFIDDSELEERRDETGVFSGQNHYSEIRSETNKFDNHNGHNAFLKERPTEENQKVYLQPSAAETNAVYEDMYICMNATQLRS